MRIRQGELQIVLTPANIKYNTTNRFKTWIWNLILPPQIRLYLPKKAQREDNNDV